MDLDAFSSLTPSVRFCKAPFVFNAVRTSPDCTDDPCSIEPEDNIAKGEGIEEAFAHLEELGLRREAEENGANELGQKLRDFFVAS